MTETKEETPKELATSEEMRKLYRALAAVQTNVVYSIVSSKNPKDAKNLAKILTKKLVQCANEVLSEKCPPGQIWNPITGQCE